MTAFLIASGVVLIGGAAWASERSLILMGATVVQKAQARVNAGAPGSVFKAGERKAAAKTLGYAILSFGLAVTGGFVLGRAF